MPVSYLATPSGDYELEKAPPHDRHQESHHHHHHHDHHHDHEHRQSATSLELCEASGSESDEAIAKVVGSDDESPRSWAQQVFVCLRPHWLLFMAKHVTLQEFSGAFGDIGTFLPLLTALAVGRVHGKPQVTFGPALFFSGLFTLALAGIFNIPIPIQPMKTVAAVAMTEKSSQQEIIAAGLISGAVLGLLGLTNLISVVAKCIPMSIVRGIQLGLGISMMTTGFKSAYVSELHFVTTPATVNGNGTSHGANHYKLVQKPNIVWFGADSVVVALLLGLLCVVFIKSRRVPVALVVFLYGIIVALVQFHRLQPEWGFPSLAIGPDFIEPVVPSSKDFGVAFVKLFLPQFPVTLLNSVIALDQLATDLFPSHHRPASVRRTCLSLASGNLLFGWFGMLPVCHGAGGLASQYAFGARSSLSMVFLGSCKVLAALLFGSSFVLLLQKGIFPSCALGVLVIISGLSLAQVGIKIDHTKDQDVLLCLITTGATLGINTGAGFYIGFAAFLLLRLLEKVHLSAAAKRLM